MLSNSLISPQNNPINVRDLIVSSDTSEIKFNSSPEDIFYRNHQRNELAATLRCTSGKCENEMVIIVVISRRCPRNCGRYCFSCLRSTQICTVHLQTGVKYLDEVDGKRRDDGMGVGFTPFVHHLAQWRRRLWKFLPETFAKDPFEGDAIKRILTIHNSNLHAAYCVYWFYYYGFFLELWSGWEEDTKGGFKRSKVSLARGKVAKWHHTEWCWKQ